MLNRDQNQNVAEASTAIQAGGNVTVINSGLTYNEVRDITLNVFKANFYELAKEAKEIAQSRAEEITEKFLLKLQEKHPIGFRKSNDPDFQYALFEVQKEYAKTGDKELGDLLIDLLVDRSKQEQRNILQIVLNESLNTAPKLTENQLASLAIIFLFKYAQWDSINHQMFAECLDKFCKPFASKIVKNLACYQHLEFASCGTISFGKNMLEDIIETKYQGLFLKGFDKQDFSGSDLSIGLDKRFIIPCLNAPSKWQINVLNKTVLDNEFDKHQISLEARNKIEILFNYEKMNTLEIKEKCIELRPYMSDVFDVWNNSSMKNFTLTSVGIAVAHANIKRLVGEFADLSIWIN